MSLVLGAVAAGSLLAVHARTRQALPADVAVPAGARRYALSSAGLSYPFAAAIARGFREAAAREGVAALVLDGRASVQKQANDIDDLVAQHVDGIAVMPLDSVVAQAWVRRAGQAGVPIAAVAAMVGDPRRRSIDDVYPGLVALVSQDEVTAGRVAGGLAARLLAGVQEPRIAIIEGAAGFPEVEQRARGFRQALDAAGVRYRIVASQPGHWTSEGGEAACQNLLAAEPRIDLLFNEADDMVVGCARAVRRAGSRSLLVGIGGSRLAIASLKAGAIDGTVCFRPEALGALVFQALRHPPGPGEPRFLSYPIPAVTRANAGECIGQW